MDNVTPTNLTVNGYTYVGGLIGQNLARDNNNVNDTPFSKTYISNIEPEKLYVSGGLYAGGLIGYAQTYSNNKEITIKNVVIGDEEATQNGYIGYSQDTTYPTIRDYEQIRAGGIIGYVQTESTITDDLPYSLKIENCNVYNVDMKGHHIGGIVGFMDTNTSAGIFDSTVAATDTTPVKAKITGQNLPDNGDDAKGCGGIIGRVNGTSVVIDGCAVKGYSLEAERSAGGIVGFGNTAFSTRNCEVSNVNIVSYQYSGGIAGRLNNTMDGYNILIDNLRFTQSNVTRAANEKFEPLTQKFGSIAGNRNGKVIKIAGLSIQDPDDSCYLVGNNDNYGTDGYIVFAYYDGKASKDKNDEHANMYACDDDVLPYNANGSKTIITDYNVIAQKDGNGNSIIKSVTAGEPSVSKTTEILTPSVTVTNGRKTGYPNTGELLQVTDISELTAEGTSGFYIKNNTDNNQGQYLTSEIYYNGDDNRLKTTNDINDAAIWYFEKVNDNYRIYTYCSIGEGERDELEDNEIKKRYLSRRLGRANPIALYTQEDHDNAAALQAAKNWGADPNWDYEYTITNSARFSNGFAIALTVNHKDNGRRNFRCTSNNGFEFNGGAASGLTIYHAFTNEQLITSNFATTNGAPKVGDTITGTSSFSTFVTDAQDYNSALSGYDNSNHDYEVYNITVKTVENTYELGKNKSPYVTTNPKFNMTNGQFLTGDGVSAAAYSSSAFRQIVDERAANTDKSYQFYTCQLGNGEDYDAALANIRSELSTSSNEYKGYFAQHEDSGIKNFPLLVAEDTNRVTLTRMINNYLRALTNTNYNFADQTKSEVFEVGLYKCTFNESKGAFDVDTTGACLENRLINNEYFFYMDAGNVDTKDIPQFTLLDVIFKDPANTEKIAYHLFVPVYVKKVLRYAFNAEIKSGTDYYWSAYSKLGSGMSQQGMFENLGNPVTIAFEFAYDRTPAEWVSALNGGDSLLTNYYKSLNLKNHNENGWADDTKMVLVDANNSDKYYYLDSPPSDRSTSICLYDFKDDEENHYTPVNLQELMTVTVGKDSEGTLTPTNENTAEGATVFDGTTYYRPIRDDENVAEADRYTVTSVSEIKPERYYLSIFTKADDTNNAVYRYEISSPESFAATGTGVTTDGTWTVDNWRANKINDKNTVINLFTGKLYKNGLELNVTPKQNGTQVMSAANNFLNVDMKATVELTQNAKDSGVGNNMYTFKNNAAIYQTFLMMYDKLATLGGSHEIGIDMAANAKVGINSYYYAEGIVDDDDLTAENAKAVSNLSSKKVESAKYIELRNEQNLIEMLGSGSNAVTLQVNFDMVYAADDLSTQFPKKDPDDNTQSTLGTKVIGYSKIASTVESAANSATYIKITDNDLYYTTTESTASLTYNVQLTPESSAGQYSYLGINSVETGDAEMFVDTYAVYDAHRLTSPGDYIELTLTLSDKGEGYVTPTAGTPIPTGENAGKALNISDYLTELKIYGADVNNDGEDDVIFDQSAAEVSAGTRVTKKGDTLYTVRVQKDLLKTKSDDVYVIPITYNVKTGNTWFNSTGQEYSNYKVSLTAATYSSISGINYSKPSYAFDHIIYTNARVLTSVVD